MIQTVRGMRDLFGPELAEWHRAEEVFRKVSAEFGYEEFRTPMLEHTELFKRGVGLDTDIVGKEMYSFEDRSGDNLTMRPEMTAPIVRAAIEHSLLRHSPVTRIWYAGPIFRHERPQKGRYRQFHQYGAECLGSPNPEGDAEIILLANEILQRIGVKRYTLEINTLGSPESRTAYRATLVAYLQLHSTRLSQDSLRRLETNPLRVLDSKDPLDGPIVDGAPRLADHLDDASQAHMASVQAILDAAGVPYIVNPVMVRGLDYYSHTVFEFTTDALGSQNAICGGGRYDPLFALIGGTDASAVGFSIGIDRVMLLLETERTEPSVAPATDVYVCATGDAARLPVQLIALRLRRRGFSTVTDLLRRAMKGQMKDADRLRVKWTATIGDDELANGTLVLKNMQTREQRIIPQTELIDAIRESETSSEFTPVDDAHANVDSFNELSAKSSPGLRLARVARKWSRMLDTALAELDLTTTLYAVLDGVERLSAKGSIITVSSLGHVTHLDVLLVKKVLRTLAERSLIVTVDVEAKPPAQDFTLTKEGINVIRLARKLIAKLDTEMLKYAAPTEPAVRSIASSEASDEP